MTAATRRLWCTQRRRVPLCGGARGASTNFDWEDALNLDHCLTDDERQLKSSVRDFCQRALMPRILKSNRDGIYEKDVLKEMASVGALGCTIGAYGCTKVSQVGYGLIAREVERVDSAYRYPHNANKKAIVFSGKKTANSPRNWGWNGTPMTVHTKPE